MPNNTKPPSPPANNPMALYISDEDSEGIARHICLLLDVNPDDLVQVPAPTDSQGFQKAVMMSVPRWRVIKSDVRVHLAWFSAIGAWLEKSQQRADADTRREAKLIAIDRQSADGLSNVPGASDDD